MMAVQWPRIRALLTLGRVAYLPTVWSNCVAGWWLGGAGNTHQLALLLAGASCLYTAGMFFNDAFDADFDKRFRPGRPIPSGRIPLDTVWKWGVGWIVAGLLLLLACGIQTFLPAVALAAAIILFNADHRHSNTAPGLMGLCRLLLYLVAASTAASGMSGRVLWCALAMGFYTAGVRWLACNENSEPTASRIVIHLPRVPASPLPRWWPCVLLVAPIALALVMNTTPFLEGAILLSVVLFLWIVRSLRPALWSNEQDWKSAVNNLLAGIMFVDWLAVVDTPKGFGLVFLGCLGMTLLLRRFAPAH
jgi:4-hydroxybenzoate polyprenyltransferase